jgi:hypothetical protein
MFINIKNKFKKLSKLFFIKYFYPSNIKCADSCPVENYFIEKNYCLDCNETCLTCSGNLFD